MSSYKNQFTFGSDNNSVVILGSSTGYINEIYLFFITLRGKSTDSGVLAELCGSEVPQTMKADQSTFAVVFETDYEFHYEGFRMYFVTEGNTTTPDLPTTTDR